MNLILRATIIFAIVSLAVFLVGGVISFDIMLKEINTEQQRFLRERLDRIRMRLERRPLEDTLSFNKMLAYPLQGNYKEQIVFSDTLVMHSQLDRIEPHLKLDAIQQVGGRTYFISIYDVIVEQDDIKEGLTESLVTMYVILLGAVLIISFIASYYLLRPFNQSLSLIKQFSLTEPDQKITFPKSRVREFKRLNHFLEEMTTKVKADYQTLKEFSENASHELQTPIAIIQGKLEMLMENEQLSEEQVKHISSAQNTLKRLSNLSNSLSILTRIENKEFDQAIELDASDRLSGILQEFDELIRLKSIKLTKEVEEAVILRADEVLLDLMLTNLINNAIRHNWENGTIKVKLTNEYFEIVNSGPDLTIQPEELFMRFKKSNQSSSSLGLGLAIVKKICDFYSFSLDYMQSGEQHHLKVVF